MRVFTSKSKLYAWERANMFRPPRWPPTTHPVPTLWERAKSLLADTVKTIGSAMTLAYRQAFTRKQRKALILRLEPVERLVRTLLCIEAITLLLMTPEGLRIRRTTKQAMPPPRSAKQLAEHNPVHAAMMTIAANQPRIDPRIAEREAREAEDKRAREAALHIWDRMPVLDRPFTVIRWHHPPPDPAPQPAPSRVWADILDERPGPPARAAAPQILDDNEDDLTGPMLGIARRIATLERVLANPGPAIRRLARRIASFPRDCLEAPIPQHWRASTWWHGMPEHYNAITLAQRAFAALDRAYAMPPDDPG